MVDKKVRIRRGDIWVTNLNPGFGREIHKTRPSIVISSNVINQHSVTLVILPITSQINPLGPEKILLPKENTNLDKDSAVLVSEIRAIDKGRLTKKIGTISLQKMTEIEESLKIILGLEEIS